MLYVGNNKKIKKKNQKKSLKKSLKYFLLEYSEREMQKKNISLPDR